MARAQAMYARMGVTTVYEGHVMDRPLIEAYRFLRAVGSRSRCACSPRPRPSATRMAWDAPLTLDEFRARLEEAVTLVDRTDDLFRVDGVTISRGGPCWPGFLLMREPYKGPYGDLTRGVSFIPREWCELAMRFAAEHRLRLNVVVAGTGEHDEYLDQLEARRPRLRHPRPALDPAARLLPRARSRRGATPRSASTSPTSMSFSWGKGDMFIERIGEHVLPDLIPLQAHARRRHDGRLRQRLGSEEHLRAHRARHDPRVLRQRPAERRPGAEA